MDCVLDCMEIIFSLLARAGGALYEIKTAINPCNYLQKNDGQGLAVHIIYTVFLKKIAFPKNKELNCKYLTYLCRVNYKRETYLK